MTETLSPKAHTNVARVSAKIRERLRKKLLRIEDPDDAVNVVMTMANKHDRAEGFIVTSQLFEGRPVSYAKFVEAVRRENQLFSVQQTARGLSRDPSLTQDSDYLLAVGTNAHYVQAAALAVAKSAMSDTERQTAISRGRDYFGPGTVGPNQEPHSDLMMPAFAETGTPITADGLIFCLQFARSMVLTGTDVENAGGLPALDAMTADLLCAAAFSFGVKGGERITGRMIVGRDPGAVYHAAVTLKYADPPPPFLIDGYDKFITMLEESNQEWVGSSDKWDGLYFAPEARPALN